MSFAPISNVHSDYLLELEQNGAIDFMKSHSNKRWMFCENSGLNKMKCDFTNYLASLRRVQKTVKHLI